jgi:hypothetical protein
MKKENKPIIVSQNHVLNLQYKSGLHTIFEGFLLGIAIANNNFWAGILGWLFIVINVRFNYDKEEEWRS